MNGQKIYHGSLNSKARYSWLVVTLKWHCLQRRGEIQRKLASRFFPLDISAKKYGTALQSCCTIGLSHAPIAPCGGDLNDQVCDRVTWFCRHSSSLSLSFLADAYLHWLKAHRRYFIFLNFHSQQFSLTMSSRIQDVLMRQFKTLLTRFQPMSANSGAEKMGGESGARRVHVCRLGFFSFLSLTAIRVGRQTEMRGWKRPCNQ